MTQGAKERATAKKGSKELILNFIQIMILVFTESYIRRCCKLNKRILRGHSGPLNFASLIPGGGSDPTGQVKNTLKCHALVEVRTKKK